jgi:hypothetical protein
VKSAQPDPTSTPARPIVAVEWDQVPFAVSYNVTVIKTYLGVTTTEQANTQPIPAVGHNPLVPFSYLVPLAAAGPIPATYKFQVTANTAIFGSLSSALSAPLVFETSPISPIHIKR